MTDPMQRHALRQLAGRLAAGALGDLPRSVLADAVVGLIEDAERPPAAMLAAWQALEPGHRVQLIALCCRSCGIFDVACSCGNDD